MVGKFLRPGAGAVVSAVLLGVLALLAAGLTAPWVVGAEPGTTGFARYVPLPHGYAWLERTGGERPMWLSGTVRRVPLQVANAEWSPAASRSLRRLAGGGDPVSADELASRTGDVEAVEIRLTRRDETGSELQGVTYVVRTPRGDHLVAVRGLQGTDVGEQVYVPPQRTYPARLPVGRSWTNTTSVGPAKAAATELSHTTTHTTVTARGARSTAVGRFEDCLRIESTSVTTPPPGQASDPEHGRNTEWVCAGVGTVSVTVDGSTSRVVSTSTRPNRKAARMPPLRAQSAVAAVPGTDLAGSDGWHAQSWAASGIAVQASEATFVPVYVQAPIPVVLAASHQDDLRAFLVAAPSANLWRFSAAGPVYGRPAVDTRAGRIYFGAADKHVYALTVGGLFLWSFGTDDNVAARPLVSGKSVIVAGEDGYVHAVDAITGSPRWSRSLSVPVVSSPARIRDVVAVATETGRVYGLDRATGRVLWDVDAAGPVTAAVVADGRRFFVVSESGAATAITSGGVVGRLTADLGGLRSDPVLAGGQLVMVDAAGNLAALDKRSGKVNALPWEVGGALVGPPVVTPRHVFVLNADGAVYRLDRGTGAVTRSWEAPGQPEGVTAPTAVARLGLAAGHGLWWADWRSILHRIGGDVDDR